MPRNKMIRKVRMAFSGLWMENKNKLKRQESKVKGVQPEKLSAQFYFSKQNFILNVSCNLIDILDIKIDFSVFPSSRMKISGLIWGMFS